MSRYMGIPHGRLYAWTIVLTIGSALLGGCHLQNQKAKPTIEITRVPPASPGGPDQLDLIEGRVTNAESSQQIVIYAHSGPWWVQPKAELPFTKIQPDFTWKNSTHLGIEYAVLLVEPGYSPQSKMVALPPKGNGVAAVAVVKGKGGQPVTSKVIHFSGYDWVVRAASSDRGGPSNAYDPENAWVDPKGYLHLRMAVVNGRWACAEVNLTRSLGYGSYRFVVQDSAHLSPSAVVGMFTMDEMRNSMIGNELDIELSRWGKAESKNSQYVVQPFYVPENIDRFNTPAGVVTHTYRWDPGKASFASFPGTVVRPGSKASSGHVFTAGVPTAAAQTVHINLYDFHHSKSSPEHPVEVVIEKFEYLP